MSNTWKWDVRFLELCQVVASWSKDPSTKTGAVIVRPDFTIASIGFNGFPRRCNDAPELYADRQSKYARIVHCEMNAILSAREPLLGYTLYTWPLASCDRCAANVIQAGIMRCVAPKASAEKLERWGGNLKIASDLFREAGVTLDLIDVTQWKF